MMISESRSWNETENSDILIENPFELAAVTLIKLSPISSESLLQSENCAEALQFYP